MSKPTKLMGAFCTSYWILQMNSHALFPNLKRPKLRIGWQSTLNKGAGLHIVGIAQCPLAALNTIERGGKLDLILTKYTSTSNIRGGGFLPFSNNAMLVIMVSV